MFKFVIVNLLISSNQSGFKPGYSSINLLLPNILLHDIYKSFDCDSEARGAFLIF